MTKEARPTPQKEKRSTSIPVETLFAPMYSNVSHAVRFGLSLTKDFKNIPGTDFPQGSIVTAKGKFSFYASPEGLHVIKNSKPTSISSEPDQLTTALFGDRPTAKDMRGALLFAGEIASMRKQAGVTLTPAELIQFKDLLINSWEAPVAEKETILGILEQRIPELGYLSTLPALPLLMGGRTQEANTQVIAQREAAQKEFQRAFIDMDQPVAAFLFSNLTGKVAHEIATHPNFKAPFADMYHTIEGIKVVDGQNPGEYVVTYYEHSDKGWTYPQTTIQLGKLSLTEPEAFYATVAEHQTGIAERLITDGRNPDAPYSVPQFVDSQGYPLHQTPEQAFVTSFGERLPKNPNTVGIKEQQRVLASGVVAEKLQKLLSPEHPTNTQVMLSPDGKYYQISVTQVDGHADTTKRITSTFSVARETVPTAPAAIVASPESVGPDWRPALNYAHPFGGEHKNQKETTQPVAFAQTAPENSGQEHTEAAVVVPVLTFSPAEQAAFAALTLGDDPDAAAIAYDQAEQHEVSHTQGSPDTGFWHNTHLIAEAFEASRGGRRGTYAHSARPKHGIRPDSVKFPPVNGKTTYGLE